MVTPCFSVFGTFDDSVCEKLLWLSLLMVTPVV